MDKISLFLKKKKKKKKQHRKLDMDQIVYFEKFLTKNFLGQYLY